MPSSLSSLQTLCVKGLGGNDSSEAITAINASINFATLLAALLFEPPELLISGNLTVLSDQNSVSTTTLTNLLTIKTVYNSSDGNKMWFVPWESWYILVPSSVGSIKYYSLLGQTLYVADTPTSSKLLAIGYSTYPSSLSGSSDTLSFDHHDSFIVSTAINLAWSFFEKGRTVDIDKVISSITQPFSLGAKARQIIEGRKTGLELLIQQIGGR